MKKIKRLFQSSIDFLEYLLGLIVISIMYFFVWILNKIYGINYEEEDYKIKEKDRPTRKNN